MFHRIEAITVESTDVQIVSDMTPEAFEGLNWSACKLRMKRSRSAVRKSSPSKSARRAASPFTDSRPFPGIRTLLQGAAWEKLLEMTDDIRAFIQENKAQLKTKDS